MSKEIDQQLLVLKGEDLQDGCILVLTVGDEKRPASREDIKRAEEKMCNLFEDLNGIKIMVIPHTFKLEVLPLKKIRSIESEVINSWRDKNKLIELDDLYQF